MPDATGTDDRGFTAFPAAPARGTRLPSIDLLRGLVMVLMALDHARDYFSPTLDASGAPSNPEDLADPSLSLFLTRWVTHFCAPVFVFLAGTGAFLYASRGRTRAATSRFLFTRGFWLIVLEFTVVRFAWTFDLQYQFLFAQVIWVIGASMIVLAALLWLPLPVLASLSLAAIAGHNALAHLPLEQAVRTGSPVGFGTLEKAWAFLHVRQWVPLLPGGFGCMVLYPLIPWVGVMGAGYAFGAVVRLPDAPRRRVQLAIGLGACALFILLRSLDAYGDPRGFAGAEDPAGTAIAFLNTEKYPPSLHFLLMTLGPAIALLPALERARGPAAAFLLAFGRVPLLFYVFHIALLHGASRLYAWAVFGREGLEWSLIMNPPPQEYVLGLWVGYVAWVGCVIALFPVCAWFARVKRRATGWWWSYL